MSETFFEPGEMLLHWTYSPNPNPGFLVENPHPETQFATEFLAGVEKGLYSGVTMKRDTTSDAAHLMPCGDPCWHGWLLDIDADNLHMVYRIGGYLPDVNRWSARWPD